MYGAQDIIVGREFEQPVRPPVLADDGPFYQQVLLCQLGLPRKRVKGPLFERRSGSASLMVQGGPWHSGKDWELQPVPYGIIPRLVLMHVCREAVRTRSPIVDVRESPRAFARELGLSEGGAAMERFRRQTIALWCCRMHLGFVVAEGHGQVKVEPFEAFRVRDPERRGLWPREIVLEQKLFEGLLDNGVPLDAKAVRALQGSALALDVYSWLAHRLCRVREAYGVDISWRALKEQFGQEYKSDKQFREEFVAALGRVVAVYADARVEVIRGRGLRLMASHPPVRSSQVSSLADSPKVVIGGASAIAAGAPVGAEGADEEPTLSELQSALFLCPRWTDRQGESAWKKFRAEDKGGSHDRLKRFRIWAQGEYRAWVIGSGANSDGWRPKSRLRSETLTAAQDLTPGQDLDQLEMTFFDWNEKNGTVLNDPDKAFLRWLPKFTARRRP